MWPRRPLRVGIRPRFARTRAESAVVPSNILKKEPACLGQTTLPVLTRPRVPSPLRRRINAFLGHVNVGDYVIQGQLDAYSCASPTYFPAPAPRVQAPETQWPDLEMLTPLVRSLPTRTGKLAGIDKKLSKSLDADVVTMMASSPSALSVSPVGPLTDSSSRKTLIYLILTLNHTYPDYDFSALRGHHFTKENAVPASASPFSGTPSHIMRVKNDVDGLLLETGKAYEATVGAGDEPLSSELWRAIDAAIHVVDCDVYTYKAVAEGDPFCDDGNLWSFNYFFYNRKLKRILYFSCRAVSKTADEESDFEDGGDELNPMDDSFLADGMEMDDDEMY